MVVNPNMIGHVSSAASFKPYCFTKVQVNPAFRASVPADSEF